jgi:CRP-like cAMP-binding protein
MSAEIRGALGGLARKLGRLGPLEGEDLDLLSALPVRIEQVPRFKLLVREGAIPDRCCLLIRGYASRYKDSATGSRQIVAFHIAGDLLDVQHLLLEKADHSVEAITPASVAWINKAHLLSLASERPSLSKALWRDSLIDASIFREWVLNVGRRDAKSRIAHMLCEFVARCEAAGLGERDRFELPFTQQQIADATALTPVHVNRMLRDLDCDGAVARIRNQFRVLDWDRLCSIADFDPAYLHAAA